MDYTSEEIRYILQNAGKIKQDGKCIECDGTGWHNYNEEGEDIKPGYSYDKDRGNDKCEKCKGIGYIW